MPTVSFLEASKRLTEPTGPSGLVGRACSNSGGQLGHFPALTKEESGKERAPVRIGTSHRLTGRVINLSPSRWSCSGRCSERALVSEKKNAAASMPTRPSICNLNTLRARSARLDGRPTKGRDFSYPLCAVRPLKRSFCPPHRQPSSDPLRAWSQSIIVTAATMKQSGVQVARRSLSQEAEREFLEPVQLID